MSVSCLFNIMCIPIEKEEAELLNPVVLHIWFPIFTYLLSLFSYLVFGILLEKGEAALFDPVGPPIWYSLPFLNWARLLIWSFELAQQKDDCKHYSIHIVL